jgi:hypothetical protein
VYLGDSCREFGMGGTPVKVGFEQLRFRLNSLHEWSAPARTLARAEPAMARA